MTPFVTAVYRYASRNRPDTLTMSGEKFGQFCLEWSDYLLGQEILPMALWELDFPHVLVKGWVIRPI